MASDCMDFNSCVEFRNHVKSQIFLNLVDTNHAMPDIIAPVV